jgi:hypothetical protein
MTCLARFSAAFVSASNLWATTGPWRDWYKVILDVQYTFRCCQTLMIGRAKKSLLDKCQTSSHLGTTKAEIVYDF